MESVSKSLLHIGDSKKSFVLEFFEHEISHYASEIRTEVVLCVSLVGLIATQADQASFWNARQKNTIHAMIILLYGLSQWMEKFMFNQI